MVAAGGGSDRDALARPSLAASGPNVLAETAAERLAGQDSVAVVGGSSKNSLLDDRRTTLTIAKKLVDLIVAD